MIWFLVPYLVIAAGMARFIRWTERQPPAEQLFSVNELLLYAVLWPLLIVSFVLYCTWMLFRYAITGEDQ